MPLSSDTESPVIIDLADPLTQRVLEVCDRTGEFIEWWGFRAIHGRVWTLLALVDRPLSQTDVAKLLGVSRALVNGAVRELEDWGLVQRISDNRRAPIIAVFDVWPVITQVLRTREWMLIEGVRMALHAAIQQADQYDAHRQPVPFSQERLHELAQLTRMAQGFLKLILGVPTVPRGRGIRTVISAASYAMDGIRRATRLES